MKKKIFFCFIVSFLQAFDKIISQNFICGKQIKLILYISQIEQRAGSAILFSLEVLKIDTI
jgi:hypothetical protein